MYLIKLYLQNFFELNYWLITKTHVSFVIIFYVGGWMIYVYNEYAAE
jgi:putative Mn2+ efflux pump MntP